MKQNITISRLNKNDLTLFIKLVALFNKVFEEYQTTATEKQLKALLAKNDFYAIVALKNNTVIGGLTAYELKRYYTDKSELYIYDIAVKTKLHNQGVGKKLIEHLKEYAANHNIETIFVEAYSEDKQAVKFYKSTFGKSEKVDHFNFYIK